MTRAALAVADHAELRGAEGRAGNPEVRVIEGVEHLGTELDAEALPEHEVLHDSGVEVRRSRSASDRTGGIAEEETRGLLEGCRVEPALRGTLAGGESGARRMLARCGPAEEASVVFCWVVTPYTGPEIRDPRQESCQPPKMWLAGTSPATGVRLEGQIVDHIKGGVVGDIERTDGLVETPVVVAGSRLRACRQSR